MEALADYTPTRFYYIKSVKPTLKLNLPSRKRKASSAMSLKKPLFLHLPREIRDEIYRYVVVAKGRMKGLLPRNHLQTLLVNRQIYHEAMQIFFQDNFFRTNDMSLTVLKRRPFTQAICLKHIRHVYINICNCCPPLLDGVFSELVKAFKDRDDIKEIHIDIGHECHWDAKSGSLPRPPPRWERRRPAILSLASIRTARDHNPRIWEGSPQRSISAIFKLLDPLWKLRNIGHVEFSCLPYPPYWPGDVEDEFREYLSKLKQVRKSSRTEEDGDGESLLKPT